ncbi:MAG: ATP-binding cassette domain-containing protein [Phycisphaeraceae bacterium]
MIVAEHLTKWYGPFLAVDDLSFSIPAGEVVGFLGPNGAGKSTSIRMITGYLPPTAGRCTIDGLDVMTDSRGARQKIGYLPESTPLYTEMRVTEYLHFCGKLFSMSRADRIKRIDEVTSRCGLSHNKRRVIGQLSKGNRQRVGIAQALLHDPPVLILDEPTSGLDPQQTLAFRDLITELRGQHTIMLSSHILPEIERAADRVIIIANGKIVAQGTPVELRDRASRGGTILVEAKATPKQLAECLQAIPSVAKVDPFALGDWTRATVTAKDDTDLRDVVSEALTKAGHTLRELHLNAPTLERYFVEAVAKEQAVQA